MSRTIWVGAIDKSVAVVIAGVPANIGRRNAADGMSRTIWIGAIDKSVAIVIDSICAMFGNGFAWASASLVDYAVAIVIDPIANLLVGKNRSLAGAPGVELESAAA